MIADTLDTSQETPYQMKIAHLNQASIHKFYLPYSDIDWESAENQIDLTDSIWADPEDSFLAQTDWFQSLPLQQRCLLGLQLTVNTTKVGVIFENILTRGLLSFARSRPDGSPEYRYAMHEVIEESHHSMMFQEFINRSGLKADGLHWADRLGAIYVSQLSKFFPELFFMFVLGGELPIDYLQRQALKERASFHPLIKKMMQIHTTEEARHISFAKLYLQENIPKLGRAKRSHLAIATPILMGIMADMILRPSSQTIRRYHIPKQVVTEAYDENPEYRETVRNAFSDIVTLCEDLNLVNQRTQSMWRGLQQQI